jgi:hypothetical protein
MSKRSQLVERFTVFLTAYSSLETLACFIMRHPAHVTPILARHTRSGNGLRMNQCFPKRGQVVAIKRSGTCTNLDDPRSGVVGQRINAAAAYNSRTQRADQSVTAPRLAEETSFTYLPSTPRV